jgi:hypothetical protein
MFLHTHQYHGKPCLHLKLGDYTPSRKTQELPIVLPVPGKPFVQRVAQLGLAMSVKG